MIHYHRPRTAADGLSRSAVIEALLFAAGDLLSVTDLMRLTEASEPEVRRSLDDLAHTLAAAGRGLTVRTLDGRYTLSTHPATVDVLKRLFDAPPTQKLSPAAYEVLAVIAYNQPVTRAQIEQIRGVGSDGPLNRLQDLGLIDEVGRLDLPGRPSVFGTTDQFLRLCGLDSARDLPPEELLMYDSLRALEEKLRVLEGEPEQLSFDSPEPG